MTHTATTYTDESDDPTVIEFEDVESAMNVQSVIVGHMLYLAVDLRGEGESFETKRGGERIPVAAMGSWGGDPLPGADVTCTLKINKSATLAGKFPFGKTTLRRGSAFKIIEAESSVTKPLAPIAAKRA